MRPVEGWGMHPDPERWEARQATGLQQIGLILFFSDEEIQKAIAAFCWHLAGYLV